MKETMSEDAGRDLSRFVDSLTYYTPDEDKEALHRLLREGTVTLRLAKHASHEAVTALWMPHDSEHGIVGTGHIWTPTVTAPAAESVEDAHD